MDATDSGNGFDAALKALEDLETTVAETRDPQPATAAQSAPVAIAAIAFDEDDALEAATAIAASPIVEAQEVVPVPAGHVVEGSVHPAAPAVTASIAAVPQPAPRSGLFGKVAIGLGLFSSMVSAAGLVVAERTIMSAQLVVADARERQHQLERSTKLIQELQIVRDKQVELLRAQQAQLAATPVSSEELQHRLEVLQAALVQRDPVNEVVSVIRSGQADTNARFNEFSLKLERIEAGN